MRKFFRLNEVFTLQDIEEQLSQTISSNRRTRNSLLRHHKQTGAILQIRRGLYASVPDGIVPAAYQPDAYQVAGKLVEDAVIGYHSALEMHGRANSIFNEIYILSKHRPGLFEWRGTRYRTVSIPRGLFNAVNDVEIKEVHRSGVTIRVTSLERSLVDVLDRPHYGGGWEEIWRCAETIHFINPDRIVNYVRAINVATTAAKVGFVLQQMQDRWMIPDEILKVLQKMKPNHPFYLDGSRGGKLISEWNLIVSDDIMDRNWEELSNG